MLQMVMSRRTVVRVLLLAALLTSASWLHAQGERREARFSAKLTLWDGKAVAVPDIVRVAIATEIIAGRPSTQAVAHRNLRFKTGEGVREHVAFSTLSRVDFGKNESKDVPEMRPVTLTSVDGSIRKGTVADTLDEITEGFMHGDDVTMARLKKALVSIEKIRSIEFTPRK